MQCGINDLLNNIYCIKVLKISTISIDVMLQYHQNKLTLTTVPSHLIYDFNYISKMISYSKKTRLVFQLSSWKDICSNKPLIFMIITRIFLHHYKNSSQTWKYQSRIFIVTKYEEIEGYCRAFSIYTYVPIRCWNGGIQSISMLTVILVTFQDLHGLAFKVSNFECSCCSSQIKGH